MRPDIDTPARRLTRQECYLHEWMEEAVAADDIVLAQKIRDQLKPLTARRSEAASQENSR